MLKLACAIFTVCFCLAKTIAVAQTGTSTRTTNAACPAFQTENVSFVPASCTGSDGAILGLQATGTGTINFTWYNNAGTVVGTTADLGNVPAGIYYCQIRDDSKCKAVTSSYFTVGIKHQVTFNDSATVITKPACNLSDGAITGIVTKNAVSYQWANNSGKIVATTLNLTGVVADFYILTATNADGCKFQNSYTITSGTSTPKIADTVSTDAGCDLAATMTITFDLKATDPVYHYELHRDNPDTSIANGVILYQQNIKTALFFDKLASRTSYSLYTTDATNCYTKILSFRTNPEQQFRIDSSHVLIHPDYCGQHIGVILGVSTLGGAPPNLTHYPEGYYWRDSTGTRLPSIGRILSGVGAGTYTLEARNAKCRAYAVFTIKDSTSIATPPTVKDVKLCLPQALTLSLNAPNATGYRIYNSDTVLIKESSTPQITFNVNQTSDFFASTLSHTCESAKVKFTVSVAIPGLYLTNTFTPNGDGINDYWEITGLDKYPGTEIFIYDRDGELAYYSVDYAQPFNGTRNGKQLPAGVYYYIIDPKKPECKGKISGSLTILR